MPGLHGDIGRACDSCLDPGPELGKEGSENGSESKGGEQFVVIEMTNGKPDAASNGKARDHQG